MLNNYLSKIIFSMLFMMVGFFGYVATTHAMVTAFTGTAQDEDWSNPANWDNGVPSYGDDALIQANVSQISNGNCGYNCVSVYSATFSNGAVFDLHYSGLSLNTVTTTTFNDTSYSNGSIYGPATFNGSSYNSSVVIGPATFNGDYSSYIPSSPYSLARYFNTATSTSRDFTADSIPWLIIADGAQVNLSGATCNASTVLKTINGGSFVYGGNCVAGPSSPTVIRPTANEVVSTWSPSVNWSQGVGGYTYSSCQYSFGTSTNWDTLTSDWIIGSSTAWHGASCTGNGSDLVAPTSSGNQIIAIRAFYNGVATSSVVDFTYSPIRSVYFYNTGSDSAWSTIGNWFTNFIHTITFGILPLSSDRVTVTGTTTPIINLDLVTLPAIINSGNTGVVFTSSASAVVTSSTTINGKATFNGSSVNNTTINGNAVFNNTSSNTGTVKNNATFNDSSANTGTVSGGATFNGNLTENSGTVSGIKTRYYTATTTVTRNLSGWTVVADGVTVNVASSTHDGTTMFRTLNGGSFIGGPTTVYWLSDGPTNAQWSTISNWYRDSNATLPLSRLPLSTETVTAIGTTTLTIDIATSTWVAPLGVDASQTGVIVTASTTTHVNVGIVGSTTISGSVINDGYITGSINFRNTASNSSTGVLSGSVSFYNTTKNNGGVIAGDAIFNDSSYNTSGGSVAGDATFNDSSYNAMSAGDISGTATFNNNAHNDGTIANDAVFYNNLTENNGTIQGIQTRYWNTSTTTTRDFVTSGPWTLVADGATVTVASSSVFSTTTTFTTVNSGHFVGEGLPGATTCTKPMIFPGTYTLSGDIAATCTIQSNGVIIDGAGHTIGHVPQALPDNAVSNGPVDMTGNVFLAHMSTFNSSVLDSSGQNNNLTTVKDTSPSLVSGLIGNALSFGGNGGIVNGNITAPISSSNDSTISTWMKSAGSQGAYVVSYQDYDYNSGQFSITIYQSGSSIYFRNGSNWQCNSDIGAALPDFTNWHLITGTFHQGVQTLYVDGVQVAQGNYACGAASAPTHPAFGLGNGILSWGNIWGYYNGLLDETALWTRALSPSEVSNMYTVQSSGVAITSTGYSFSINDIIIGGVITSPGATIDIANSTVASVNVTGGNATGDAQAGGTIILTNTTAGALIANGGNSTDYGYGGAAGTITLDTSTALSQTANPGSNGPNLGAGQQHNPPSSGSSGSSSVSGCTDPSATNYNSSATADNGSCRYSSVQVRGCTDPSATNYNSSATINNGSCHYPTYTPYVAPSSNENTNNNNNNNNLPPINGINIPVASVGGSLYLKPLPTFGLDTGNVGDTVLGNPLAGLKPLGNLKLTTIPFSLGLPISSFLFAPLPKSVTDALSKAPKLAQMIAAVGISRAQDLVALKKQPVKLPIVGGANTPGLFIVKNGTTTLDTFVANDPVREMVQLVYANPGDVLNVSLVPLSKGKVVAKFQGQSVDFFKSPTAAYTALIEASTTPGRYLLTTASAPLPLAVEVLAPQPPPKAPVVPVPWWKRAIRWFGSKV